MEVVVFTHNHEAFVEQALESVLSQETDFGISLRIHDDASTDRTVELINRLLSTSVIPWRLVEAPENRYAKGILFFHEFIAQSSAEFIAILDGDDFWTDNHKLRDQVDALDRSPTAALCHHPVMESAQGRLTPIEWPPADYRREIIPGSMLTAQNVVSTSSVVLRASMFPRTMPQGFNNLRIGDYPMWSLAATGHDIAFVDRPMSAYRIHDSNIWASLESEERFDRELEARIYISNNAAEEDRALWRSGIVNAVQGYFDLASKLRRAESELEIQAAELSTAQQELHRVLASKSWAVTKPLRVMMRKLRRTGKA